MLRRVLQIMPAPPGLCGVLAGDGSMYRLVCLALIELDDGRTDIAGIDGRVTVYRPQHEFTALAWLPMEG